MNKFKTAMNERRFGKFSISMDLIRREPDWVHKFLQNVLVLQASFSFAHNGVVYEGVSLSFDPVIEGQESPFVLISKQAPNDEMKEGFHFEFCEGV